MFTYKSTLLSICISLFIYIEYFFNIDTNNYDIIIRLLNTILSLYAFLLIFDLTKKELFGSGFFIGIFWFWWIGYSFVYYNLSYLIPVIIIGIGIVYGLLFFIIGLSNNIFYKVICIYTLSFIEPFGFNWFKIELPFINSYIGNSKIEFLIIIIISAIFVKYKDRYKKSISLLYFAIVCILILFNTNNEKSINKPNLKIYQYQSNIAQDKKWEKKYKRNIINDNFKNIDKAIQNNYELIILPETAFPLVLNHQKNIQNQLLEKSKEIAIITGALYEKNNQLYNSTYLFQNNTIQVAHKVVLVPFGEAVPLPEKLRDWINNVFYDGAQDYKTAKEATTFEIKGFKFRNAICYEATTDTIYKNLDTPYVIAISNNAWFTPSHQPTLQKLLLKYYEKKYNLKILNITNQG